MDYEGKRVAMDREAHAIRPAENTASPMASQGAIAEAMGAQTECLTTLHDVVFALESKLAPILRPRDVSATLSDPDSLVSDLANDLFRKNTSIIEATNRLRDLLNAVDL